MKRSPKAPLRNTSRRPTVHIILTASIYTDTILNDGLYRRMDAIKRIIDVPAVAVGGTTFLIAGVIGGFTFYTFEDTLFGSAGRRKLVAVAAGFTAGIGAAYLVTK